MEDEQKIKTSIYLAPSVHKRVKQRALDLEVKETALMAQAVEQFLNGAGIVDGPARPPRDPILASLSPEDRARVVALIEMLSGESTGVEHLDLMKAPVIGYLDTWASQTQKQTSGRKKSGKHA